MKIAIASGKGGTGKTTVACNFSSFLQQRFLDNTFKGVALVDLDVEEPNSSIFISPQEEKKEKIYKKIPEWKEENCSFCNKCVSSCRFNALAMLPSLIMRFPELCHSCFVCEAVCPHEAIKMTAYEIGEISISTKENFHFIEGKLNIGEVAAPALIKQCKDYVEKEVSSSYWKIYDCPPGTSCSMIEAVKSADIVLLVTESTPFGLHDLQLAVETLRLLELPFAVIINKYDASYPDLEEYLEKENVAVFGRIPIREEIAVAYSAGKLINEAFPEIDKIWENTYSRIKEMHNERDCNTIR
jgi:MinD superfamily P-loop ATPase